MDILFIALCVSLLAAAVAIGLVWVVLWVDAAVRRYVKHRNREYWERLAEETKARETQQ